MMNQHLESWLLADHPQHGRFSMGLANIELKRGTAPDSGTGGSSNRPASTAKDQAVDLEESIFAFSKAPDEQIGRVRNGGSTGAKVRLFAPKDGNNGQVVISSGDKEASFDVAETLGCAVAIAGQP